MVYHDEAFQYFFYWQFQGGAAFVDRFLNLYFMFVFFLPSPRDINVKSLAFTPYCAVVCGGGGQSSGYNHPNIYHDPAISYSI